MTALFPVKRVWHFSLLVSLLGAFLVCAAPQALAQSLDSLRASGQVGEAYDGYARARDSAVKSFVDSVNAKRRTIYQQRAQQQGISAEQVGKVYAKQIIAKAPSGTWLLAPNGTWTQK